MSNRIERLIKRNARQLKDEYLESCGSAGGEKPAFVTLGLKQSARLLEGVGQGEALNEMLAESLGAAWDERPRVAEQLELMFVNGHRLESEYSFRAKDAVSGFRTIKARFMRLQHYVWHCDLLKEKADEVNDKWRTEFVACQAAIERAGGNLGALMKDVCDREVAAAAE